MVVVGEGVEKDMVEGVVVEIIQIKDKEEPTQLSSPSPTDVELNITHPTDLSMLQ